MNLGYWSFINYNPATLFGAYLNFAPRISFFRPLSFINFSTPIGWQAQTQNSYNWQANTQNSNYGFDSFEYSSQSAPKYYYPNFNYQIPSFEYIAKPQTRKKQAPTKVSSAYQNLSKAEAITRARKDGLEELRGGERWNMSSFINDIPFAGRGINNFLDHLTEKIDSNITVTSALATKNSPHSKNGGHYDAKNPKLDFGGQLSYSQAQTLKRKLDETGYFTRVEIESHGNTAHLDVKIKDEVLSEYA